MNIPNKVMSPNAKDLIAGDQDLGFLEEQIRKILDNTLLKYAQTQRIIGISYSIIGIGYLMVYLLNLHHSYFLLSPIVFLGMGLLFIITGIFCLVGFTKKFVFTINKRFANVRDWKKFLDNKEGTAKNADPRGRVEVLIWMVSSMNSWLYTEKNVVIGKAMLPMNVLSQIGIIMIFIPRYGEMNDILFVLSLSLMFGGVIYGLIVGIYLEYKHTQIQKYWRPRLMIYWIRLDGYMRMLWRS